MNEEKVKKDGKDMLEILKMREEGVIKSTEFELYPENWKQMLDADNETINIVIIINIIPNSFVLSYLAALRNVLSAIFETSINPKKVTINVLFMEDVVIPEDGAWERDFVRHYARIIAECETKEKIRKNLVKLKRSEFESLFNMVLRSFDDLAIKEAIRKRKIVVKFNNLSKKREELGISIDANNFTIECTSNFLESITDAQNKMFFKGKERAIIYEMKRLLDHWMKDPEEKFIFIAVEVFKKSIEDCYTDLWNEMEDNNIIWFKDPPIRDGKMLMYLNPLSRYVNRADDKRYIELEELYHKGVLTALKSNLFKHRLEEMQNKFDSNEEDYNTAISYVTTTFNSLEEIKNHLNIGKVDLVQGDLDKYMEFNILQLRSHQTDVINKGFLTVQEEILQQLDLIL